jgi:Uma2 family endonuclease
MHPYRFGRGGPGGWRFLDKPEIRVGQNILVPDIAGWKKDRFPAKLETNWIDIPPDWIGEVLFPRTLRIDKTRKMPIYARHAVGHIWRIHPMDKTLEVFKLASGGWLLRNTFAETDNARADPSPEAEIDLGELWRGTPSLD